MNSEWAGQFIFLGISLLLALLVWSYYRRRTFPLEEKYSTFGPRFWTGSVDSCVLWPVGFMVAILLSYHVHAVLAAILVTLESVIPLVYTVIMQARYGMTVGKMVTKVRVVDYRTEGKISYGQSWLREGIPTALSLGLLGYQVFDILSGRESPHDSATRATSNTGTFWLLGSLPLLWFVAEVLTMLTNKKRRALHDFIAGTVVIRTNLKEESIAVAA